MTTRYDDTLLADALAAFLAENPGYDAESVDALRGREYERLDRLGHVYLDYTGGGLYAQSQIREHLELLGDSVLGTLTQLFECRSKGAGLSGSAPLLRHAALDLLCVDRTQQAELLVNTQTVSCENRDEHAFTPEFRALAEKGTMSTHYNETRLPSAHAEFLAAHPEYDARAIEEVRARDYGRLDRLGHVYLDYTGGGLYAESQVREHLALLSDSVLGNPHSKNPTSLASTLMVEETREAVLEFFSADPSEYDVIFTANASGALKLVGESYPFGEHSRYLLTYDNHNSVNGIREFARSRSAAVTYLPVSDPDLRLDCAMVTTELERASTRGNNLFAFPAQSNFSGVQHPLEWVEQAHEAGWDVILDCAAFAPSNRLDLSAIKPDFVPLSFYKMFGYPTGSGALIVRREALAKLSRPWFAGGTITLASVQGEGWYHLAPGHVGFEDGTLDYLGLPAVRIGLEHVARIGVDSIHDRVVALTSWLLAQMGELTHANGSPMVRLFGPDDMECRGATIAFYLLAPDGTVFDVHRMEELAGRESISLRTGCFCNPGDGEVAHQITRDDMAECFAGHTAPVTFTECTDIIRDASGKMPNTMRISLGIASTFADAYRFMAFAAGFRDMPASAIRS